MRPTNRFATFLAAAGLAGSLALASGQRDIQQAAADDAMVWVCARGHSGMGSGGMGDLLTGIIAGLVAQGMQPLAAAQSAVWLHARAAERAALKNGGRGMLATDLLPELRRLLNQTVV